MQKPIIQLLVWMRVPGDTIFSIGALALAWFVFRLWVRPARASDPQPSPGIAASLPRE
jgi:nitric oxide reductase subunit B